MNDASCWIDESSWNIAFLKLVPQSENDQKKIHLRKLRCFLLAGISAWKRHYFRHCHHRHLPCGCGRCINAYYRHHWLAHVRKRGFAFDCIHLPRVPISPCPGCCIWPVVAPVGSSLVPCCVAEWKSIACDEAARISISFSPVSQTAGANEAFVVIDVGMCLSLTDESKSPID